VKHDVGGILEKGARTGRTPFSESVAPLSTLFVSAIMSLFHYGPTTLVPISGSGQAIGLAYTSVCLRVSGQ